MITEFEVDCGQVMPSHRLIAHGLRAEGRSDDSAYRQYSEHYPGKPVHPMVCLVYSLVPGLDQGDTDGSRDVDATARLDPPADPAHWKRVLTFGGFRDALPGGTGTKGGFGPFVFPERTRRAEIRLRSIPVSRPGTRTGFGFRRTRTLGTLQVDIASGTGRWIPRRRLRA